MANNTMTKSHLEVLVTVALMVALITVGAWIRIPGPFVPFTLQFLATTLAALLCGARVGALACGAYVFLGLCGVPIFAAGGGLGYVLHPSFGYLIGFIVGAYVAGRLAERAPTSLWRLALAGLINLVIVYALGLSYLIAIKSLYLHQTIAWSVFWLTSVVFLLPGDLISVVVAALVARRMAAYVVPMRARWARGREAAKTS